MNKTSFMNMQTYQPDVNFRDRNLCFIDLEFTGLDLSKHEILSIAGVLVEPKNYAIIKEQEWKIKIQHPEIADPFALEKLHYFEQDWSGAMELQDVLEKFNTFLNFATLVGFNIAFDWSYLSRDFEKLHIKPHMDYHMLDIMSLGYLFFLNKKRPKKLSLRAMARELDITVSDTHSAIADARATYELFKKLIEK